MMKQWRLAMPKNQELRKETIRFRESPLGFKLSTIKVEARKKNPGNKPIAHPCSFCGSVKLLGDANARAFSKSGRAFCDEECASEWKSIHYASANHKPFEESRQRTRAKQAIEAEAARRRAEEREVARLIKPVNNKTPGYVTCIVCQKTVWVEQHPDKKYCSKECSRKAHRQTDSYKANRRESKRNREHIKRSKGIGDRITMPELMKKHKGRCVNCQTICVKPEGYNWDNEANIDHVLPIAAGGLHIWSNVQLLCRRCNMAKRDKVAKGTQLMLDLRFK
jgi:hypothetical protein